MLLKENFGLTFIALIYFQATSAIRLYGLKKYVSPPEWPINLYDKQACINLIVLFQPIYQTSDAKFRDVNICSLRDHK